jgi:hypothetical protein
MLVEQVVEDLDAEDVDESSTFCKPTPEEASLGCSSVAKVSGLNLGKYLTY